MSKLLLLNAAKLQLTLQRLACQLFETHTNNPNTVLIGLQPRGVFVANRLKKILQNDSSINVLVGALDVTFDRDDFRDHKKAQLVPSKTQINFPIQNKRVILVDDVLYTGRTIRAALSALSGFGRPQKVELLALIDRKYSRDLPIQPDFVGREVNTIQSQVIRVEWCEQGFEQDAIWLQH
ncbi:MAG: bifunctional pyr operon transcriptional regulator/uracil phosphoribosyltransferase PyrR [Cytophagales bacterium]|nr:MAG: bifunctional pyr operon transcriptional regulator/uracil phosphoribosyltransferase PyrR [Cytophagales bacterium]TAF61190.1 MAG: bifunctional pyr operon transcriptional regulator/uracil phosphoribosyltransferase PyrR [Cytophagales bacterium]